MNIKQFTLLTTCIATLAAQGSVVRSVHLPMGGDSFSKWRAEWLEPGTAGERRQATFCR